MFNIGDRVKVTVESTYISEYDNKEGIVIEDMSGCSKNAYLVKFDNDDRVSFFESELSVVDNYKDAVSLNVNSDEGPALFYLGTDGTLYRLDEGPYVPDKQRYLLMALIDYVQDGINGKRPVEIIYPKEP